MMAANQKPSLRMVDVAIRERLVLIPFCKTFTEDKVDKKLPEKLKNEASGILTWALEGAQQYLSEGLPKVPDIARLAALNYLTSEDQYSAWVDECIQFDPNAFTSSKNLKESYNQFSGSAMKRATRLLEYLEQNFQSRYASAELNQEKALYMVSLGVPLFRLFRRFGVNVYARA